MLKSLSEENVFIDIQNIFKKCIFWFESLKSIQIEGTQISQDEMYNLKYIVKKSGIFKPLIVLALYIETILIK